MSDESDDKTTEIEISSHIIRAVAKTFLPEIQKYYSKSNNSLSITEAKEMDDEKDKVKPAA